MKGSSRRAGIWGGIVAWGKQVWTSWWRDTPRPSAGAVKRTPDLVTHGPQPAHTWVRDEAVGLIGDTVDFVGGPLDGLQHTLWNCCPMPPRMAVPVCDETFEVMETQSLHSLPVWPMPADGVSSIAIYTLYPSPAGWRYHYEASGKAA